MKIVIVGSGLAGYMLVKEIRKHDKACDVVIITQSPGDFYSKPQLSTALTKGQSASDLAINSVEAMAEQWDARILSNLTVTAIDREQKKVWMGEQQEAYDYLVLACGARPVKLTLDGNAADSAVAVNNLVQYAEFRDWLVGKQHVAVLGGGLVGCEFMNDLMNSQHQVTMIAPEQTPLTRFLPASLGEVFADAFAQAGVSWRLGCFARSIDAVESGYRIGLSDESTVVVDGVMRAVGLQANVSLAEAAGLAVERGIVVDQYLRSNDECVFALGDCAQVCGWVLQYVAPILQAARALGNTLCGEATPVSYPPMPVVVKTPLCPVVALPPEDGVRGEWVVSAQQNDGVAKYFNREKQLCGFALMGAEVKQRGKLIKEMNSFLV